MTSVRVLYFAGLRDEIGVPEEWLTLPAGVTTVGELCAHLARRHPAYGSSRGFVRVAKNEEFVTDREPVAHGDVVALLPPLGGG